MEAEHIQPWRDGDHDTSPATYIPGFEDWLTLVADHTGNGRQMARVRIVDTPVTEPQEWERWVGHWNIAAGEQLAELTRDQAHQVGLLPDAGVNDWWLLDRSAVIDMEWGPNGEFLNRHRLIADPQFVEAVCQWWDLAFDSSTTHRPVTA